MVPVLSTRCRPPELGRPPSIIGSQLAGHQSHTQCDWGDQDRTGVRRRPLPQRRESCRAQGWPAPRERRTDRRDQGQPWTSVEAHPNGPHLTGLVAVLHLVEDRGTLVGIRAREPGGATTDLMGDSVLDVPLSWISTIPPPSPERARGRRPRAATLF